MAIKTTQKCESFTLPLIPLTGSVFAFPQISISVNISNPVLLKTVEYAQKTSSLVYLATEKNPLNEKPSAASLFSVGTVARIKQITKHCYQLEYFWCFT